MPKLLNRIETIAGAMWAVADRAKVSGHTTTDIRRTRVSNTESFTHVRVHVLYKRPEIPANASIPAFVLSVT